MKARTASEAAWLCKLLGDPTRVWILLELGDGPCDTTALAVACGCAVSFVSTSLTALRRTGLVETTSDSKRRVYELTPAGRGVSEAVRRLAPIGPSRPAHDAV
jgi:DNA-binding HxlR family transcriptional regulator